ncbi:MAG TPA: hypothetical protein VFC31_00365 [Candidatus Limnocylindria bacterium]|nr:hypothetical protein [Candidatus Limnocylindria bacterium]
MDVTPASQLASPRLVPVSDLHPWGENPRAISPKRFENLRRAIAADPEFLRLRPVLARADGTVYCGNQRYLAAVANGMTAVPAVLAPSPSPASSSPSSRTRSPEQRSRAR